MVLARFASFILGLASVLSIARIADAQELPQLTLEESATTVSGLSSGGFMAVQLHVAFSERIAGAGIVAGGPYFCSRGEVLTALNQCMQTVLGPPDSGALLAMAQGFAAEGEIDSLSGLEGDRVYLFTGTQDRTVTRPVMDAARDFYLAGGIESEAIQYVTDVPSGHAFLAEGAPGSCAATAPNYINDCNVDQAGDILNWLYDDLVAPAPPDHSRLIEFDQSQFLRNPESHGMDARGFAYVPAACLEGETCRLHIAFHGCEQTPDQIGDLYARTTGYNAWAEGNDIVVLYPQAQIIPAPIFDPFGGNPKGCWDWFAYDDPNFAVRRGRQMAAVAGMAAHMGAPLGEAVPASDDGPFCKRHDGFNQQHLLMGRAFFCSFNTLCAHGSGEILGPPFAIGTLFESPMGRFSKSPCQ
jgi:poly(3-hydroxybutyrate) depolymerase